MEKKNVMYIILVALILVSLMNFILGNLIIATLLIVLGGITIIVQNYLIYKLIYK